MITYNGIIDYFKEFANNHLQINSFTEGSVEKIDSKKINDYPILHIDITGSNIQDNTIIYSVDAYIITAVVSDNEQDRINALGNTLLIMQDLRTEFFKGKYILNPRLLLRGDEDISCTPIEEDFQNRVYGWSTSLSVTGVNESTACNIPYPSITYDDIATNLIEDWNGEQWLRPFETTIFDSFYWWTSDEKVVKNGLTYSGTKIHLIGDISHSSWLNTTNLTSNHAAQTTGIQYNEEQQAYRFSGVGEQYYLVNTINTPTEFYYYFGLKVKNIKSLDAENTALFSLYSTAGEDGIKVFIGSPTSSTAAIKNKICLSNWDESSISIGEDITDGSGEYVREESLTFGLEVGGDEKSSVVKLLLDGRELLTQTIPTGQLTQLNVGNNQTGSTDTCTFDLQEVAAYRLGSATSKITDFKRVLEWLKYR